MDLQIPPPSLIDLVRMKREQPEEYEQFLIDMKIVIKDVVRIGTEAYKELK